MNYQEFLTRVVDDGIAAAKRDYVREDQKNRLEGSIAGFESCRSKLPSELSTLLSEARESTRLARAVKGEDYWRIRCFESEVEWVCNVVSSMLRNQGLQQIVIPTCRGLQKAAEILGVEEYQT